MDLSKIENEYARKVLEESLKKLTPEMRETLSKETYGTIGITKFLMDANFFLEEGIKKQLSMFIDQHGLVYYYDMDKGVSKVAVTLTSKAFMDLKHVKDFIKNQPRCPIIETKLKHV